MEWQPIETLKKYSDIVLLDIDGRSIAGYQYGERFNIYSDGTDQDIYPSNPRYALIRRWAPIPQPPQTKEV